MARKRANLYCQTAFLGDLFLAIPSLKHLKAEDSPLVLCCRKGMGSVFKKLGLVDDFVEVDKSDFSTWKKAVEDLRKYDFENIFSPHLSFRMAWNLKSINSENKIGFHDWWNFWFFNKRIHRPMNWPEPLRQLSLVAQVDGALKEKLEFASSRFINTNSRLTVNYMKGEEISPWASMSVRERVRSWESPVGREYVFLAPGSVCKTKRWDKYAQLARVLLSAGESVALVGSPDEVAVGQKLQSEVSEIHNFIGQWSLENLLSALSHGKYLVSNDSGVVHMAAAVDLPTISLLGPTTLDLGYRPWNRSSVVVQKELSCRPCRAHNHPSCPIGTHECMKGLPVRWVLDGLSELVR